MNPLTESRAKWIWIPQETAAVNQYADFRHSFTLENTPGEQGAAMYISADTEYAVWVNGQFVDCGQYDDYPRNKSYDTLDVSRHLKPGGNVVCVRGYCQGRGSFQYIAGRPGVIYALRTGGKTVASGEETLCRQTPSYHSGPVEEITMQLSFSFRYDASREDGWLQPEYLPDGTWGGPETIGTGESGITLYRRPNRKLLIEDPAPCRITAQGVFIRKRLSPEEGQTGPPTAARRMQRDYLSARTFRDMFASKDAAGPALPSEGLRIGPPPGGNDGVYAVVDMGMERMGFFCLELSGEPGVAVDVAYGEHLDDLRVRSFVGGRNFAFEYTCRDGRQQFVHYHKKIAGRYIGLHITGIREGVTLYYAGIAEARYPLARSGRFECGDRLMERIHDVSRRTLEICMLEHYVDTPWREQGLYAMDSRNQALCGYYCFGEYDYPESAFSLFVESLKDDGMFELCAPSEFHKTIPSFSLAWILAIRDLVLFSGRTGTARRLLPTAAFMLEKFTGRMERGLIRTPAGERYWNFYEWADGLDGSRSSGYDAPLCLFFHMALSAAADLARWSGETGLAGKYAQIGKRLAAAVRAEFWDSGRKAFRTYAGEGSVPHYAELTQALALDCGIAPEGEAPGLRRLLSGKENGLVKTTLSFSLYKYEALLQEPETYAGTVFGDIADQWGHMLYNKATSFWETIRGADDFDKAGSLSHGWSAIPAYFFCAYILGVKPLEPGFAKYSFRPVRHIVERACGTVPTPGGDLAVRWFDDGSGIRSEITPPQ